MERQIVKEREEKGEVRKRWEGKKGVKASKSWRRSELRCREMRKRMGREKITRAGEERRERQN